MVWTIPCFEKYKFNRATGRTDRSMWPSGSGKSTTIRCINHLEEHQQGRIVVDGIELNEDIRNIERVRQEVGMVFQHFNLFPHLTVLQNCTLAPIWGTQDAKERG